MPAKGVKQQIPELSDVRIEVDFLTKLAQNDKFLEEIPSKTNEINSSSSIILLFLQMGRIEDIQEMLAEIVHVIVNYFTSIHVVQKYSKNSKLKEQLTPILKCLMQIFVILGENFKVDLVDSLLSKKNNFFFTALHECCEYLFSQIKKILDSSSSQSTQQKTLWVIKKMGESSSDSYDLTETSDVQNDEISFIMEVEFLYLIFIFMNSVFGSSLNFSNFRYHVSLGPSNKARILFSELFTIPEKRAIFGCVSKECEKLLLLILSKLFFFESFTKAVDLDRNEKVFSEKSQRFITNFLTNLENSMFFSAISIIFSLPDLFEKDVVTHSLFQKNNLIQNRTIELLNLDLHSQIDVFAVGFFIQLMVSQKQKDSEESSLYPSDLKILIDILMREISYCFSEGYFMFSLVWVRTLKSIVESSGYKQIDITTTKQSETPVSKFYRFDEIKTFLGRIRDESSAILTMFQQDKCPTAEATMSIHFQLDDIQEMIEEAEKLVESLTKKF